MKKNETFTIVTLLMLFFGYLAFQYGKLYFAAKKDRNRLENVLADAGKQIQYYKAQNGQLVAKNNALQLRYHEVKNIFPGIIEEIRNMKIKPERVLHFNETVVTQEKQVTTTIRDSLIFDTIHAKVFDYQDAFYTIKGIAIGDTQKVRIESRDSLIQVVYKGERYRPWLWFLSKRKIQQSILTKNPNSKVTYSRQIEFLRKRR